MEENRHQIKRSINRTMLRARLMHEWAKNSELTRRIGPKFTSLRRGAIEEATCRIWARPAQPMVRPNHRGSVQCRVWMYGVDYSPMMVGGQFRPFQLPQPSLAAFLRSSSSHFLYTPQVKFSHILSSLA